MVYQLTSNFQKIYCQDDTVRKSRSSKKSRKKGVTGKNTAPELAVKATEYHVNERINELHKKLILNKGSGIALK